MEPKASLELFDFDRYLVDDAAWASMRDATQNAIEAVHKQEAEAIRVVSIRYTETSQ